MALLSPSAMSLYERLVTAAALSIDGPGLDSDGPCLDRDDPGLAELLAAGFAELDGDPPSRVVAVALPGALERALSGLQAQFLDQQRQLLEARAYFDAVAPRFARAQDGAESGVRLTGSFTDLVDGAVRATRRDIACWNATLPAVAAVRVRAVYDIAFLKQRGGRQLLRAAHAAGHELRVAPDLPTSMVIVDRSAVVFDLDGPPDDVATPSRGVAVGSALVADAMSELFELVWQRALPYLNRDEASEILTPVEHEIAAMMAVGRSDEEIATNLGMSVRTVRRHVAAVMDRLQAGTRFAAGVAAARAGLLDDTDIS